MLKILTIISKIKDKYKVIFKENNLKNLLINKKYQ